MQNLTDGTRDVVGHLFRPSVQIVDGGVQPVHLVVGKTFNFAPELKNSYVSVYLGTLLK